MPQPSNCNEKCSSYDYCKDDGVFGMFIANAVCPDYCETDSDKQENIHE